MDSQNTFGKKNHPRYQRLSAVCMMQKNDPTKGQIDRPMSPAKNLASRDTAMKMSLNQNAAALGTQAGQVTDNAIKNSMSAMTSNKKVATNFYKVSSNGDASAPDGDPKVILKSMEQLKDSYEINGDKDEAAVDEKYMDKEMQKNRNPMSTIQELAQKAEVSNVLKKYNELFVESGILERIIPRHVSSPAELKEFNQYILKTDKDYKETDIDAINDVSEINMWLL